MFYCNVEFNVGFVVYIYIELFKCIFNIIYVFGCFSFFDSVSINFVLYFEFKMRFFILKKWFMFFGVMLL